MAEKTQEQTTEAPLKVYKVFVWRNPIRGEIAVTARNEKEARKYAIAKNANFAQLLTGAPLVIDPTERGDVVFRWRRG
jgi:hypothetical protein